MRPRTTPRRFAMLSAAAFALAAATGPLAAAGAVIDPNAASPAASVVDCGDGTIVTMLTPHVGFSAASASDAQLDANGLPTRPPDTDAAGLAEWQKFVAMPNDPTPHCGTSDGPVHTGHPITAPTAGTAPAAGSPDAGTPDVGSNGAYHSSNWAGNVANNQSYTDAYGKWKVPNAGARPSNAWTYSSAWVGVGSGDARSTPLIQAGSDSYNLGQPYYDLWWEMYPQNNSQTIGSVLPGDTIYVHAHLTANNDWTTAEDLTSGLGKGQTHSYKTTGIGPSNQAEWILERPDMGGALYPLADAPTTFLGAAASGTGYGGTVLANLPHYYDSMYNCTNGPNQRLAYPGSINSAGGFTVHWVTWGVQSSWNCSPW